MQNVVINQIETRQVPQKRKLEEVDGSESSEDDESKKFNYLEFFKI